MIYTTKSGSQRECEPNKLKNQQFYLLNQARVINVISILCRLA
jgi:hypothetical protein